jgi:3-oxoacyl-[acyl-carrier protein] reductase
MANEHRSAPTLPRQVLITGSSRGIGRALAEHFLALGDAVIGCSRTVSDLLHPNYKHICADMTQPSEIGAMMSELKSQTKRLDVLINNAGAASMTPAALQPPDAARELVELNLNSVIHVTHDAIRLLKRSHNARIINLTTVAVPWRLEGEAVYSATKAAIEQWTRVLAKELGPMGITCNAIGPSPIETDLIRAVPTKKIEQLLRRQAIPRFGNMRDMSHLVDFLIHSDSDFITGQVIYLGGVG